MKRRYLTAGLAILLIVVVALAFAGPTSAGAGKWQPYTSTYFAPIWVPPTFWPEWKGDTDGDGYPNFVPCRSINERYEGMQTASAEALTGYQVVRTNGTWMVTSAGVLRIKYTNKSTLYVGSSDATEGPGGRWEMTASGLYTYDMVNNVETHTVSGQGHGVSGDVKGWVMNFTTSFPGGAAHAEGFYLAK